jgi:hypothetical protein
VASLYLGGEVREEKEEHGWRRLGELPRWMPGPNLGRVSETAVRGLARETADTVAPGPQYGLAISMGSRSGTTQKSSGPGIAEILVTRCPVP